MAKEAYTTTHTQQAASQKEVVGLLERKASWTAADLERYMSLIRSEHLNEQAVQAAQEQLDEAERTLEEARTTLEKKERKQYHEEQIWSDTIRRNSTWVTFGLMGVNIFLLLSSLLIFEPWRRRRLVREVRAALEEKTVTSTLSVAVPQEVDRVVEPAGIALEEVPASAATVQSTTEEDIVMKPAEEPTAGSTPLASGEVLPEEAVDMIASPSPAGNSAPLDESKTYEAAPGAWQDSYVAYRKMFQDLFSDRQVQLKKVDVTTIALEGAAAGVAVMGFLFVLLRPR